LTADTVKLEVTQQMVELKQNGENMADLIPPNTSKTIYTVRRDGEIFLLCTTYGQGMEQPRLEEVFRFIYPNREVKLGETWTRNACIQNHVYVPRFGGPRRRSYP
ncbi:MAG: hypothetical protein C4340_01050, partial [Armatimonadota bacterium]